MKSKLSPKYNVFISWLLSYFFVFLIPLLISLVVYAISANIIEQEVDRIHLGSLKQLKQVIDGKLREIEKISIEVALNEEIEGLVYEREPFAPFQTYNTINVMKKLNTFKIANDFIDVVGIYFQNNKAVLSSGMYDMEDWYQIYFKDIDIDYEEYEKLIRDSYSGKYRILPTKSGGGNDAQTIAFLRSLPVNSSNTNRSNLIITTNQHIIKQLIRNIEWSPEGTVAILDNDSNIIVSTKKLPNIFFNLAVVYKL